MNSPDPATQPPYPPGPMPPYPPPGAAPPAYQQAPTGSQGLAIASMVLGILGFMSGLFFVGGVLGLAAVILGIVSLVKKQAGKGMAISGVITGAFGVIASGFMILIMIVAYGGVQDRAVDSNIQADASHVAIKAEAYNVINDKYPTYNELINATGTEAELDSDVLEAIHEGGRSTVTRNRSIAYSGCSAGAIVYYWSSSSESVRERKVGDPAQCDNIDSDRLPTSQQSSQPQRL